jgi:hypothetical protein
MEVHGSVLPQANRAASGGTLPTRAHLEHVYCRIGGSTDLSTSILTAKTPHCSSQHLQSSNSTATSFGMETSTSPRSANTTFATNSLDPLSNSNTTCEMQHTRQVVETASANASLTPPQPSSLRVPQLSRAPPASVAAPWAQRGDAGPKAAVAPVMQRDALNTRPTCPCVVESSRRSLSITAPPGAVPSGGEASVMDGQAKEVPASIVQKFMKFCKSGKQRKTGESKPVHLASNTGSVLARHWRSRGKPGASTAPMALAAGEPGQRRKKHGFFGKPPLFKGKSRRNPSLAVAVAPLMRAPQGSSGMAVVTAATARVASVPRGQPSPAPQAHQPPKSMSHIYRSLKGGNDTVPELASTQTQCKPRTQPLTPRHSSDLVASHAIRDGVAASAPCRQGKSTSLIPSSPRRPISRAKSGGSAPVPPLEVHEKQFEPQAKRGNKMTGSIEQDDSALLRGNRHEESVREDMARAGQVARAVALALPGMPKHLAVRVWEDAEDPKFQWGKTRRKVMLSLLLQSAGHAL